MCDLAFISFHDLDIGVDHALLQEKIAGSEITGLDTTKGFKMKRKMLQDLVRARESRKTISKEEREEQPLC